MRYAIVSDIHANMAAWRNVLTDIADLRTDKIICLGDILGYGPDSVAVLESVYQFVDVTLQGNHDAAICRRMSTDSFFDLAADAISQSREKLTPAALQWLRSLPLTHAEAGFRCAHGDFSDPQAFRYITEPADAQASWHATEEQLLFVGHSHVPGIFVTGASGKPYFIPPCDFELEKGKRYIVNPGSVGYPRAGEGRSSYCIYDSATSTVVFRQLPFDSAGLRQALLSTGLRDDLWLRQKELLQKLPTVREKTSFSSTPSVTTEQHPPTVAENRPRHTRQKKRLLIMAALLGVTALAGLVAASWLLPSVRKNASATHAPRLRVPDFELPAIIAYPLTPPDKNLLPPLPLSPAPPERFTDWRYEIDNPAKQSFHNGLRDGASTLIVRNRGLHNFCMESPLINLDGIALKSLRLRGVLRKHEDFNGSVFYQVITYTRDRDGEPRQHRIEPFEMRTSRRKMSPPGAMRDVRIRIPKAVSHVRFRIEADFEGALEIEQPHLSGEVKTE